MMPEPDFDQIARTLTTALGFSGYGLATLQASIAEKLRLIWNARGKADMAEVAAADATAEPLPDVLNALRALDR